MIKFFVNHDGTADELMLMQIAAQIDENDPKL